MSWQEGVEEQNCLVHGGQEAMKRISIRKEGIRGQTKTSMAHADTPKGMCQQSSGKPSHQSNWNSTLYTTRMHQELSTGRAYPLYRISSGEMNSWVFTDRNTLTHVSQHELSIPVYWLLRTLEAELILLTWSFSEGEIFCVFLFNLGEGLEKNFSGY